MFVADTNVLVYAADESAPEHARCRALLERWRRRNGAWYVTWGITNFFAWSPTRVPFAAPGAWIRPSIRSSPSRKGRRADSSDSCASIAFNLRREDGHVVH
jgi:predicted nucleic acid-binding protein